MDYKEFLKKEMVPAFGCTEPIALAYAAGKAVSVLEEEPASIDAYLSGNMIKNANSVTVPGTDGRKGLKISITVGAILGDPKKELEVLANVDKSKLSYCDELIERGFVNIKLMPNVENLYIEIIAYNKDKSKSARVIIKDGHTNIILIEKDGEKIFEKEWEESFKHPVEFSFDEIYDFANTVDYSDIEDLLEMEARYNYEIAKEGIEEDWGSNIGSTILKNYSNNYSEKLVAFAAAGSDARMDGCEKPVIINSGSGNQGITVAVPIVVYAMDHKVPKDKLYRALILGNLLGLYQKDGIGKLSAYCGVVSAATASVCAIGYMKDEPKEILEEILANSLAVNSGLICDGAKPSCAMKIASSLRNALLAYDQAKSGNSFKAGDGIVKETLEETLETVSHIAKYGMKSTDEVILNEIIGDTSYIEKMKSNKN